MQTSLVEMASREQLLAIWLLHRRKKKKSRRYVRELNLTRTLNGEYVTLVQEMRELDEERHFMYFRMSFRRFQDLLERVRKEITYPKNHRFPISPDERLVLTLRYLATGDSQQTLAITFRLGKSTVSQIIYRTCEAIWNTLSSDFVRFPDRQAWQNISEDFWKYWNYPHCLGAIDGKHTAIKAPLNAGSDYYNYKHFHSIVLLGIADAKYSFVMVDIGAYGRRSDAGILCDSTFGKKLASGSLDIPEPKKLPGSQKKTPYVFVGDEAFPLKENMMRPYPGKH